MSARLVVPKRSSSAPSTSGSSSINWWTISSLEIVAAPWRANAASASLFPAPMPPVIATATGLRGLVGLVRRGRGLDGLLGRDRGLAGRDLGSRLRDGRLGESLVGGLLLRPFLGESLVGALLLCLLLG